ncbi:amidase [Bhargavaea massiliensis]|uniref:amidase n=1 Tax=Bhargavaea massiliensis TaxID=2697500 RepID=UPI001BCC1A3A|nr:amidase [Bhargavaea massiliensis]
MTDLIMYPAEKLAPLIRSKQLSPVELTRQMLDRIEEAEPVIRAFITPPNERILEQARQAEKEIMRGEYRGPLHGIPVGIKDNYWTEGIRTTDGFRLYDDFVPEQTATSADRLLKAGTIMIGKLNMHELASGLTGTNPFYGTTRNPWDTRHMPGGSSGGSGAALAAGMAVLATGTDTFGSIRMPASMCGVYGLKPTYGLVSTFGVIPAAPSLDHAGPMARSVWDLAQMLQVMAGHDPKDPGSLHVKSEDYTTRLNEGIGGFTIGVPSYYMKGLDPDIERLFRNAIAKLERLGAEIIEIELPELSMATFAGMVITNGEAAATQADGLKMQPKAYSKDVRTLLLSGALSHTTQYIKAQQARRGMVEGFRRAFREVDFLLGPVSPMTTPKFSDFWEEQNLEVVRRSLPFTSPANLTGVPSLSLPMGLDTRGLPAGMQLIGPHLSEARLLQAGYAWEQTKPIRYWPERTTAQ